MLQLEMYSDPSDAAANPFGKSRCSTTGVGDVLCGGTSTTRHTTAAPASLGTPVSSLTYSAPSGPRSTHVGTASDLGGLSKNVGGAIEPFDRTSSSVLEAASTTQLTPGSVSTL